MKKNYKVLLTGLVFGGCFYTTNAQSVQKIGSNPTTINKDAVLDLESASKGLLIPRVELASTALASPLSTAVAGMVVYNTKTINDVTPGFYYNDGTKWIKSADAAAALALATSSAYGQIKLGGDLAGTSSTAAAPVITDGAVTASKLNQMQATNGQVLKWSGTAWAPATDNDNASAISALNTEVSNLNTKNNEQDKNLQDLSKNLDDKILTINGIDKNQNTYISDLYNKLGDNNTTDGNQTTSINGLIEGLTKLSGDAPISISGNGLIKKVVLNDGGVTSIKIADGAITGAKIADNIALPGTASMILPSGTTPQRPTTATAGMSRYNTDDNIIEYYNGTAWVRPTAGTTYTGSTTITLNGTSFERPALTGDVTAALNSNTTTITDAAVTTAKLAADAVTSAKILNGAVATDDLAADAVTSIKIADASVTTAKIQSGGNGKVLVTTDTGTVQWTDMSSFDVIVDNKTITGSGSTASPFKLNSVISNASTATFTASVDADGTIICDVPTGGMTVTIPVAATDNKGRMLRIRKVDEDNDVLTFSQDLYFSSTTKVTTLNYVKTITIQSDGTKWWIIKD